MSKEVKEVRFDEVAKGLKMMIPENPVTIAETFDSVARDRYEQSEGQRKREMRPDETKREEISVKKS